MSSLFRLGLAAALAAASPAAAQSDADLLAGLDAAGAATGAAQGPAMEAEDTSSARPAQALRWHLETDATAYDRRPAYPAQPDPSADASARARLAFEGGLALGAATTLRLNGALTLHTEDGGGLGWSEAARFDLREAYVLHQSGNLTFEIGRINIRNGVAQGFNPVDFFRAQDVGQRPDLDPSEARRNRLGVVAARVGYLWDTGAASFAYLPRITGGDDLLQDRAVWGLNLGATNPTERMLFSVTQELTEGVSPEVFALIEEGDVTAGVAASVSVGDNWLIYGEATRGAGLSLMDAAFADARTQGRLSRPIAAEYGAGEGRQLITRAALGVSYTAPSNIVATLEYHHNGAGFSAADWDRYFALAGTVEGNAQASAQLASVSLRGALTQEPMSQDSLWLRVVKTDPVPGLTLSALGGLSLEDGSGSLQLGADYDLADGIVLTGRLGGNIGPRESDYGSRSSRAFGTIGVAMHF